MSLHLCQEEIEAALLKAARDQVENLMQVVDKMQNQQTKLLEVLQTDKKKVSSVSLGVPCALFGRGAGGQERGGEDVAELYEVRGIRTHSCGQLLYTMNGKVSFLKLWQQQQQQYQYQQNTKYGVLFYAGQ